MQTSPPGHNGGAVIDLVNARIAARAGAGDGAFDDGRRLALIVEGGGMRGVLSAGSLYALDLLGCHGVFDAVFAASAGGVNAAYFLSGQGGLGISVYFDDISSLRFANPLRFWKILDVDYVYDHIVPHVKPLDEAAIRRGRTDFFLGLTDVDSGESEYVDVKASSHRVAQLLKASSAIPVLYNRTITLGARRYVDGGLSDLLPLAKAATAGFTDVLVLTTRVDGHLSKRPPYWERTVFYAMMGWMHPALHQAYSTNFERTRRSRAYATGAERIAGINVATISPTAAELVVGRATRDRMTLVEGARRMGLRTAAALGRPALVVEAAFDRLAKGER